MLKTVSSITNAIGALNYKGTWNASANTPTLASGAGTKGDYYVVSVAGTTSLDGISNWGVGDWAAFNGSVWQRVEGGADLNGVNLSVSGNAVIGDTTFALGTTRLYVKGDATNPAARFWANTDTTSVYAGVFRHESTTAGAYIQFVTDSNVETGRIYDSAGTMQYASSSDARLKTNIQPIQNGLSSVLALNACTFDMRRGENTFIPSAGLIAQEVHEVYPFVVGIGGDDENTNPWSVDYGKLTPLLIAAIKEQQAQIETLKAEVATLKGA